MDLSTRLKQWHNLFAPDELNQEARRLEKLVMRIFEIYKKPPINKGGIFYSNPENEMLLKKLIAKLVPKAWEWEILYVGLDPQMILGRFVGFICDEQGNVL